MSGCTSCSVVEISDYLGNREDANISMCLMERNVPGFSITQVSTNFFKGPVGVRCRSFLELLVDLAEKVNRLMG